MSADVIDHSLSKELRAACDDYSLYGRVHDLEHESAERQQQLDAANQRIKKLDIALANERRAYENTVMERDAEGLNVEAAERKLATARDAVVAGLGLALIKESDEMFAYFRSVLAQIDQPQECIPGSKIPWSHVRRIEQPHQQLPGEDPPFDMCQCSACVALRTSTGATHA